MGFLAVVGLTIALCGLICPPKDSYAPLFAESEVNLLTLFIAADALCIFRPPSSKELSWSSLNANLEKPKKVRSSLIFICIF